MNGTERFSCQCRDCSLGNQLNDLSINASGGEEPNVRVAEEGQKMACNPNSPAPQASSLPLNSVAGKGDENNDTGFCGSTPNPSESRNYLGQDLDVPEEGEQLKTPDHSPESSVSSSNFKPVGGDYWFRTGRQSDHIDLYEENSWSSFESYPCWHRHNSTTSSSSDRSYRDSEAEKEDTHAKNDLNQSPRDCKKSHHAHQGLTTPLPSLLRRSSDTMHKVDYELYRCILIMQEALESAHHAIKKLRNAQSKVINLGRDVNASLNQASTSILHASVVAAKQSEVCEKGKSHHAEN